MIKLRHAAGAQRVAEPRSAGQGDSEVFVSVNCTDAPFPDDVVVQQLIEAQVSRRPQATAVICEYDNIHGTVHGTATLTYTQLNQKANQLAHLLMAEGVGPGHIVALMVNRSFAMIIGILGIIKAGAAYLPIAPDNPVDRTTFMLQDAGVRVLLVQDKVHQLQDKGAARTTAFAGPIIDLVIDLNDAGIYRGCTDNPEIVSQPCDLAYVIYTSGSTGKPKGVMIEHRALVNRLHWMQSAYPIGESDVILQKTPYFFDVSVWELFWWALHGASLCLLLPGGEKNPMAIADAVAKHAVSVIHFVPSMLNVFLQHLEARPARAADKLATVRHVFASGEALAVRHVRLFNDYWGSKTGARLTNLYGPTEATIDVSYFDCPAHNEFDSIPIGRPIHNTRLYIIKDGRELPPGETGELCIAGVGLARGYLNNNALTDEKFTDNPAHPGERIYRTGDLARWRVDGNIEYLGRQDHQVKIRGLRIELGEIESTIREYPGISDCIVVVREYSDNIVLIIAYVVCGSGLINTGPGIDKPGIDKLVIDDLKEHLRKSLPDYMIPNRFEHISELPLTASGKADRLALHNLTLHEQASQAGVT